MNNHNILYILRHIDIGAHIDIPYKKIGITGKGNATLTSRLQQISNTKSPIQAQCIAAWEFSDAKALENALHTILSNDRIEGEWFYDQNDDLLDRLNPILDLINAKPIEIIQNDDYHTKAVIKKEKKSIKDYSNTVLGEILENLNNSEQFRTSIRIKGPTFFSDKSLLTYYINVRKSGKHKVLIGRSKEIFSQLNEIISTEGYELDQSDGKYTTVYRVDNSDICELINLIEKQITK